MSYSNFAMHCYSCDAINEPVSKNRKRTNGNVVANYRCDNCDNTFRQTFKVDHKAEPIEKPELKEPEEKPPAPEGDVLEDWSSEDKDFFIEHYGREAYKELVNKKIQEGGRVEYQAPEDQPDMPTDHNPKNWTPEQRDNYIEEYGRDAYQDKVAALYAPPEED
jgi:hypothetical protein